MSLLEKIIKTEEFTSMFFWSLISLLKREEPLISMFLKIIRIYKQLGRSLMLSHIVLKMGIIELILRKMN